MATTIQLLRSDIPQNRPDPGVIQNGVPMVNIHESEPGLFFSDRNGSLFKVGPVHVGEKAPNSFPNGQTGNSVGELWFDRVAGSQGTLKVYDGSGWKDCATSPGGTVTSVGLSFSGLFDVSGGPVTSSGTLLASLKSQNKNKVFSAPESDDGVPTFRFLTNEDIPGLSASKIISGILDTGRIPGLDATKITGGVFSTSRIPNLDTSKLTSGTLPYTRGGTGIDSVPADGELLIGDGFGWSKTQLSHDPNISITNGSGTVSVGLESTISVTEILFGGSSLTNPALRTNSESLEVKLGDDSDFTNLSASSLTAAKDYTVSTLPSPAFGMIAHVDDASAPVIGSPVVGGGALTALCWYNGSTWTVIGI